jgi:hypothetical protein
MAAIPISAGVTAGTSSYSASLTVAKTIVGVAASAAVGATAVADLSPVSRAIAATPSMTVSATADLSSATAIGMEAMVSGKVSATGNIDLNTPLASGPAAGVSAVASLGLAMPIASKPPEIGVSVVASARLDPGRNTLGVCDLVSEILVLWGIECINLAPSHAKRRALHDLNASLQEVWNQAKDRNYWTRQTISVVVAEGEFSAALDDSIQNVIGPARLASNNQPLVPIGTRGELDQSDDLYFDESDAEEYPVTDPAIYFVERTFQAGNEPCECTLHIRPAAPEGGTTVKLDVVKEAPRITWNDVDVCQPIAIPHKYVETLLLPILRFRAMDYYLFIATDRAEAIAGAYASAKALLENADPLPGKTGEDSARKEGGRP